MVIYESTGIRNIEDMGTSVGRFMGDCDTKICHREGRRMVCGRQGIYLWSTRDGQY